MKNLPRVHLEEQVLDYFGPSNPSSMPLRHKGFDSRPWTLGEFVKKAGIDDPKDRRHVVKFVRTLVAEGVMDEYQDVLMGAPAPWTTGYLVRAREEEIEQLKNAASRGYFHFAARGFGRIRDWFHESVLAISSRAAERPSEDPKISSGFKLGDTRIVTAAHCVLGRTAIVVHSYPLTFHVAPDPITHASEEEYSRDEGGAHYRELTLAPKRVLTFSPSHEDLAVMEFDEEPFPEVPGFALDPKGGFPLDEAMVMGFPAVPGFDNFVVSEKAAIAARGMLSSTTGQVVGRETAYLKRCEMMLLTARIKGGSSGGPATDRFGQVIGVVCSLPASAGSESTTDDLGYALATPADAVVRLIDRSGDFETRSTRASHDGGFELVC